MRKEAGLRLVYGQNRRRDEEDKRVLIDDMRPAYGSYGRATQNTLEPISKSLNYIAIDKSSMRLRSVTLNIPSKVRSLALPNRDVPMIG